MAPLGFSPAMAAQQTGRVLPGRAYICTRTEARSAQGGTTYEWPRPDGAEPIPCGLAPKGGGEYLGRGGRAEKVATADRIDERREDVMLVPAGTAITQHDRLEVADGETYEVILVPERSIELLLELDVREIAD